MPISVLAAVTLSVLLGFLVPVVGKKHVDTPQVRWDINRGPGAYLTMLDQLRKLAVTSADGRHTTNADTGMNLAVTDTPESRSFADIVISSDNRAPTVHATVRLSDFYVVRFFSSDTSHDFVLNLTSDVPHKGDATHDNWFLGKKGYDALTRVANQSLAAVNLSGSSLENSLKDLGIGGTDPTAQARGMLRYIIAITEASRFRPIANHIASGMDNGSDVFLTAQQVGLMCKQDSSGRM